MGLYYTATSSVIPPQVKQSFNKTLLERCYPTPTELRAKLQKEVERKYKHQGKKWREYEQLMHIYEEVYGWIEATKAYDKAKNKEAQERPIPPRFTSIRLHAKLAAILSNVYDSN